MDPSNVAIRILIPWELFGHLLVVSWDVRNHHLRRDIEISWENGNVLMVMMEQVRDLKPGAVAVALDRLYYTFGKRILYINYSN